MLAPLIPELRRADGKGRPRRANREVSGGIMWVLRTGAQWADLPERYPPYQTCHRRFQERVNNGVLKGVLEALAQDLERRGELELNPPQPRKTKKPSPAVVAPPEWPAGRCVQIDATRLSLAEDVCWVYHVLDVESQVVLASKAVRSLSMQLAKAALDEGVAVLRSLGICGSVLVQSDGDSDFTGEVFQTACLKYGAWVRCKVSQKGGMGVLEKLNRTYKYAFAFRQDWRALAEVQTALPDLRHWYNRERRHSALGYGTPWATLTGVADPRIAA